MKKLFISFFLVAAVSAMSIAQTTSGNQTNTQPGLKQNAGFWVVESNRKTPRNHMVYFYTSGNELAGQQKMDGRKLNFKKAATRKMLNDLLDRALKNWVPAQSAGQEHKSQTDSTGS